MDFFSRLFRHTQHCVFQKEISQRKWIKIKFSPLSISLSFEGKCINVHFASALAYENRKATRQEASHVPQIVYSTPRRLDSFPSCRFVPVSGNLWQRRGIVSSTTTISWYSSSKDEIVSRRARWTTEKSSASRCLFCLCARRNTRRDKSDVGLLKQRIKIRHIFRVFQQKERKEKREGRSWYKSLPNDFERSNASSRERVGFVTKSAK